MNSARLTVCLARYQILIFASFYPSNKTQSYYFRYWCVQLHKERCELG